MSGTEKFLLYAGIALFCLPVFSSMEIQAADRTKQHPCLFVNDLQVKKIRSTIKNTHRALWYDFKLSVEEMLRRKPPQYRADRGEQLWQRAVGETIASLAFAGLIADDPACFEAAAAWAAASCNYPSWGLDRDGKDVEYGLPYGHQLLGLAMLYDYGQEYLDNTALDLIRKTMIGRTSRQYAACRSLKPAYMQNHTWINATGMLAAALALRSEYPESEDWIRLAQDIFRKTASILPPDGASQEGVGYWTYGMEFLLASCYLSREAADVNYFDCPWFKQTASYAAYLMIPRRSWNENSQIIDIADARRVAWYGPEHIFRALAAINNDGISQWYADETGKGKTNISWYNILYYNPDVKPVNPAAVLPTLKHFTNMDIVSARSDWSGKESMLVFKCGAPLGKFAGEVDPQLPDSKDLGHVHPDANHFVVFANGEYLIKNNGYVRRQTKYHNTLLIDGKGQWGEIRTFFSPYPLRKDKNPQITSVIPGNKTDRMTGDASRAYYDESGLKKFVRQLIYVKPDALIVVDDIETDTARNLSLLFYPEFDLQRKGDHLLAGITRKNHFRMESLTPENCVMEYTTQEIAARHGSEKETVPLVVLKNKGKRWRSIIAFSWSNPEEKPVKIILKRDKKKTFLIIGDEKVEI
jgi:hypothetical protein